MIAKIVCGDVRAVLRKQPADSFDACLTDPPYGLSFMGKVWDHGIPGADVWREVYRVLKPGAPMLVFGGTRTFHRLACAIEDAGFRLADTLCWLHGQGFPKGHSQLKPAWEPITLAWKKGNRVLNIDGSRIPSGAPWLRTIADDPVPKFNGIYAEARWTKEKMARGANTKGNDAGRWPANVLLDEASAAQLDAQSGILTSGNNPARRSADKHRTVYAGWKGEQCLVHRGTDSGGASRFFYVAKASKRDRGEGNNHPTVKPTKLDTELARYLLTLILPPKQGAKRRLLVPFSGSGSEILGAKKAGWEYILGIDNKPEYVAIAEKKDEGCVVIHVGDALKVLRSMADESVQCSVTSPPYWGLRNYHVKGQLGLEPTPELYVAHLVEIFREVRRVLKNDGVLWLNLGDCYATGGGKVGNCPGLGEQGARYRGDHGRDPKSVAIGPQTQPNRMPIAGLKPKDLVGIPWRVAFALQADGWYLRSDIIWHKPNPMPESVRDRPTKGHEYMFLLAKSQRYYYDADAIKEPCQPDMPHRYERGRSDDDHKWADGGPGNQTIARTLKPMARRHSGNVERKLGDGSRSRLNTHLGTSIPWEDTGNGRNKRTVWTVTTKPFKGAHFATFPPKLIEPCILAGSRIGDTILDPFAGAGTTGLVAQQHERNFVGIELNPKYVAMARARIKGKQFKTAKQLKHKAA